MTSPKMIDLDGLAEFLLADPPEDRKIVAVAGPPGSGKSTVSAQLSDALNARLPGSTAVLAMDGFHYDDAILSARGWLQRKGAPYTFDFGGFASVLSRLCVNSEPEIAVPVFDRSIEIARNSARIIPSSVKYVVAEGNYLLLDKTPWSDVSKLYDVTVFLNVQLEVLRARLEDRWSELPPERRAEKLELNDLPNAKLVLEMSGPADFIIGE